MSERRVRVRIESDCAITLDGETALLSTEGVIRERDGKVLWSGREGEEEWIVKRAQWRVRVEPVEYEGERRMQVVLIGVKVDAIGRERRRNVERGFLGSA
jgi:hypothetical protein